MTANTGHVFYRDPSHAYPVADRAEGVFIWDASGKRYLDGSSGALVVNIGHGRREVVQAMVEQAGRVAYVHNGQFTNPAAEELASLLAEHVPGDLNRVYFVSGGSEATEAALKLARQYHVLRGNATKWKVISRWTGFHGNTLGALSMSGHVARRRTYAPLLVDFPKIEPSYPYRCGRCSDGSCDACSGRVLEQAILREGPEHVAAFIAEPLVGAAGGAITPPPGYFQTVREICDRYDVLFIADEVMTGGGRTGRLLAVEHWDVTPDLAVMGKGLASGYAPLAGLAVRDAIHDVFGAAGATFNHGHTFGGHPVSCAAGLASVRILLREALAEHAASMGERVRSGLERLAARYAVIGEVRGLGLMLGVELVRDRGTKEPFPAEKHVAERLVQLAFDRGLIVYPGAGQVDGVRGDQFMVGPPLVIAEQEADLLLELLDDSLRALERELR